MKRILILVLMSVWSVAQAATLSVTSTEGSVSATSAYDGSDCFVSLQGGFTSVVAEFPTDDYCAGQFGDGPTAQASASSPVTTDSTISLLNSLGSSEIAPYFLAFATSESEVFFTITETIDLAVDVDAELFGNYLSGGPGINVQLLDDEGDELFGFNQGLSVVSIGPGSYSLYTWLNESGGYSGDTSTVLSVNASVVPVPAAVWLFFSAFGVLGLYRSKTTRAL